MGKGIEVIQVCFNQADPDQAAMLAWVRSRKNRSGYLKRLIQRDMDAAAGSKAAPVYLQAVPPRPAVQEMSFEAAGFI